MAKTERFEFSKRLAYAEPITISMPENLHLCVLEIEFPNGLFEQVTRDTRMGARRDADVERVVEFNLYVKNSGWRFKRFAAVRNCTRYHFTAAIDLPFRAQKVMFTPPTHIKIVRESVDGENDRLRTMSVLKGMTVTYEPVTRTIVETITPPEVPRQP